MTQSIILATGQAAATSTDVVVAAGEVVTIGLFTGGVAAPSGAEIIVAIATPGQDQFVAKLTNTSPTTVLSGPGTFKAKRGDITEFGVDVGVFTES
jgi:hypothetical protein